MYTLSVCLLWRSQLKIVLYWTIDCIILSLYIFVLPIFKLGQNITLSISVLLSKVFYVTLVIVSVAQNN